MSGRLAQGDQAVFRGLADALLPATGALPSASGGGAGGEMLDRILGWRPDLAPDLVRGVIAARAGPPGDALQSLQDNDPAAFDAIRLAVLGAYYLDPRVMQVLGYTGQRSEPVPADDVADYLQPGLLDPVRVRGTVWRPDH